jgi:hypothetical protein
MMRPELDPPDIERLRVFARTLRVSPRQLIVVAARCVREGESAPADHPRIIEQARAPGANARAAAALLLTPPAHFAQDELAPAIASVFPVRPTTGD